MSARTIVLWLPMPLRFSCCKRSGLSLTARFVGHSSSAAIDGASIEDLAAIWFRHQPERSSQLSRCLL